MEVLFLTYKLHFLFHVRVIGLVMTG